MTFSEYVKSLKKITINDIIEIINEDVINQKQTLYGFFEQREFVFFGEFEKGRIPNKYLFLCKNEETLCEDIYNLLEKTYKDKIKYFDENKYNGIYEYYAEINNSFAFKFPNYNSSHQKWIYNQIKKDENKSRKK